MLEIRQRDLVPLVWRDAKLKSVVTCELLTSSSQHRVEYQGLGKQTCRLLESRLYPPSSPSRSLFFSSLSPNLFLSLSPLSQSLSLPLNFSPVSVSVCLSFSPTLSIPLLQTASLTVSLIPLYLTHIHYHHLIHTHYLTYTLSYSISHKCTFSPPTHRWLAL